MDLDKLRADVETLLQDDSLYQETNLAARTEALDLVDYVDEIARFRRTREESSLKRQGRALRERMVRINKALFERLRAVWCAY